MKDILGVYGLKDGVMLHVTPHNKDEDSYSASLPRVQTTTSVAEMEGLRIEVEKLRAENAVLTRKLEEKSSQLECTVCMENDRNVVFAKCHHLVVCGGCAEELKECPVCRGEVKEKSMDVYWS
ncbi:RING-HC finger protein [Endozoicomonas elysicola]|uniref:RING-HC finger protein n=1 Tax=Endozoicomonas elysicola TaxID=305900 RepID=UPI0003A90A88|nr:RING-HC finger protein [Endozoicomonas elysicola]